MDKFQSRLFEHASKGQAINTRDLAKIKNELQ